MPNSMTETPEGLLLIASGLDEVARWDGLTTYFEMAGVEPPEDELTLAGSGSGDISGDYTAYLRFVDNRGNFSNLSPISTEVTVANVSGFSYTNVAVPTSSQVVSRQILRNTDGQATTYYVDVDTDDLSSTTFSSTKDDDELSTQEAVPILDEDGDIFANRYTVPPNNKAVLASHLGRMFAAVEVAYTRGCLSLTTGSTTVTGIGTEWTSSLEGRFLYVVGASRSYEIDTVNTSAQTLVLTEAYEDPTDAYAVYAIRPPPANRRIVQYSEAGLPEAWPATNGFSLQEDGDEITGLMTKGAFLYVLERRHIYRFTFQSDPARDGFVFLSALRGCVNNRCWVIAEDTAYMLDEQGVHAFGGGQDAVAISTPIQDVFRQDGEPFRINWAGKDFFHAALYADQEVVRWFVNLSGSYLPRHALCYHYRSQAWWIEEYPFPIASSCAGTMLERPQVYLGSAARRTYAAWQGSLDGPDPLKGTCRGTVTSSTPTSFTDSAATFASSGLVGSPVVIVSGTGKGQVRIIASVSGTRVNLVQPWTTLPDTTSTYQLGGVPWRYKTGWFRYVEGEELMPRRVEAVFDPTTHAATLDVRVYHDHSTSPKVWRTDQNSTERSGMASTAGSADLVADLTKTNGFVQQRLDQGREQHIDGPRFVAVELRGVNGREPVTVYQLVLDGAVK